MVHHIILWKIKGDKTEEEKELIRSSVKKGLEGLQELVPGIERIFVQTEALPSSTADLMLDSVFVNEQALKDYAVNPHHVQVADAYVRLNMEIRMCLDYED